MAWKRDSSRRTRRCSRCTCTTPVSSRSSVVTGGSKLIGRTGALARHVAMGSPTSRGRVRRASTASAQAQVVGGVADLAGQIRDAFADDARGGEALADDVAQHLAGAAQLLTDHLGLAHQGLQDPILRPLGVEEIAAEHFLGRLELAVD